MINMIILNISLSKYSGSIRILITRRDPERYKERFGKKEKIKEDE